MTTTTLKILKIENVLYCESLNAFCFLKKSFDNGLIFKLNFDTIMTFFEFTFFTFFM